MSLRYIHLRVHDLSNHNATPDVKGGATIAYEIRTAPPLIPVVVYYIAKCNMKDNFCKKIGRQIAGGRLMSGKCSSFTIKEDTKNSEVIKELIDKYHEQESKYWPDVKYFVY